MSPSRKLNLSYCEGIEVVCAYALRALPPDEAAAAETHIDSCPDCQHELGSLRPVINRFVFWPIDVLRPTTSLQGRLALRIAGETGTPPVPPPAQQWREPEWEQVAPGIETKLLATDTERHRMCMLMRLSPGTSYRAQCCAGAEELLLIDGELWIGHRKLFPGDYNCGAPGTGGRVWSETGCTCFLAASTKDVLP